MIRGIEVAGVASALIRQVEALEVRPHGEGSSEERFRSEPDEALAGVAGEQDPIETIGRLGARLTFAAGARGRGNGVSWAVAAMSAPRRRWSHRNGYEPRTV